MGFSTVLIISLAAGVILIVGGGLMMYMGNLVKSAYEIKVQINTEIDERLTKMAEDLDKKSRWIKRDLLEEIEKIKLNLQSENANKLAELVGPLMTRLDQLEGMITREHAEWVKAVDSDRSAITNLDNRLKSLTKQVKGEDKPATVAVAVPPADPAPPAAEAPKTLSGAAWLPDLGSTPQ